MVLLSMDFYIPPFERKLFQGPDGRPDMGKIEASYDRDVLDELRSYPGLVWKIWAIEKDGSHGSGYYLFADEHSAEVRKRFAEKFYNIRGMFFVKCRIRTVIEGCSEYTKAPIRLPANPPMTPEQERRIMHPHIKNPVKLLLHKKRLIRNYEKGRAEQ